MPRVLPYFGGAGFRVGQKSQRLSELAVSRSKVRHEILCFNPGQGTCTVVADVIVRAEVDWTERVHQRRAFPSSSTLRPEACCHTTNRQW